MLHRGDSVQALRPGEILEERRGGADPGPTAMWDAQDIFDPKEKCHSLAAVLRVQPRLGAGLQERRAVLVLPREPPDAREQLTLVLQVPRRASRLRQTQVRRAE